MRGSSNAFRVRAYETAARSVEGLDTAAAEMSAKELEALRGGGEHRGQDSGVGRHRPHRPTRRIAGEVSRRVRRTDQGSGRGTENGAAAARRTTGAQHRGLKAAIEMQALRGLPGMGAKTEENIKTALDRLGVGDKEKRTPILDAMRVADDVVAALSRVPGVIRAEPMGSLRRFRDTTGDVDVIVVSTGDPDEVMAFRHSSGGPRGDRVRARKSAILSVSGMQIDVRVMEPSQFGAAAVYFTGSKAHNIRLRQMAIERRVDPERIRPRRGRRRQGDRLGHRRRCLCRARSSVDSTGNP